jgi:hypothetical protein
MLRRFFSFLSVLLLASCTSVEVVPIPLDIDLKEVSVKENPKVIVEDFLPLIQSSFTDRGIKIHLFNPGQEASTAYILSYTALQSWDAVTYLSHAELKLEKNGKLIGSAIYHLNGKGGLSLFKWQDVKTKMTPVMNELLQNYPIVDESN